MLPSPPPALVTPLRSVLPLEDSNFSALIAGSSQGAAAANKRVEVCIHKSLSLLRLGAPIQFGLFAASEFRVGEEVTPYGGVLRSASDVKNLPADRKTHVRRVGEGFVLDGLPLAEMLDRPIPQTANALALLIGQGMQARQPAPSRFAAADLERFAASAFGFMANTQQCFAGVAPLSRSNVSIGTRPIKMASILYKLPVLIASQPIAMGDEIICPYGKPLSPEPAASSAAAAAAATPSAACNSTGNARHMQSHLWALFPSTPQSAAAASAWLAWCQKQPTYRWQQKRSSWHQLMVEEEDDDELRELSRDAGSSFIRAALLGAAYDLTMVSQQILRSSPGGGLQDEHCDASTLEHAEGCYSLLMFLTAGESTSVPVNPASPLSHRICWSMSSGEAQHARKRGQIPLSTHAVQPGAAMVLSHKLLHHAPRNNTSSERFVLFQHWIPSVLEMPPDSEWQRLPFES